MTNEIILYEDLSNNPLRHLCMINKTLRTQEKAHISQERNLRSFTVLFPLADATLSTQ